MWWCVLYFFVHLKNESKKELNDDDDDQSCGASFVSFLLFPFLHRSLDFLRALLIILYNVLAYGGP